MKNIIIYKHFLLLIYDRIEVERRLKQEPMKQVSGPHPEPVACGWWKEKWKWNGSVGLKFIMSPVLLT